MNNVKYDILINNTSKTFSERGFDCILPVILFISVMVLLLLFPIAGIALAIFAYGFLCVGSKQYLLKVASGKRAEIESVFSAYKISVKAFVLKVAVVTISCLWAVVFILPGIITALNYSMASYVMADENSSVFASMEKSKKLVDGNRWEVFIVFLSYIFVITAIFCICTSIGIVMYQILNISGVISAIVPLFIALFFIVVFVIPYFELMFANVYLILKNKEKPSKAKTVATKKTSSKTRNQLPIE